MEKVALVTGASRGIGRAIALQLASLGYQIIINYRSGQEQAESVQQEIHNNGGKAILIQADISSPEQIDNLVKQSIDQMDRIDVLVNNAGITRDNLLIRMKPEEWQQVIDTNLLSVVQLTDLVSEHMMSQGSGKIVNISSIVGVHGNAGQANYATAKAAVTTLTKIKARKYMPKVQVNCIAPGLVATDMTAGLFDASKMAETSLGRAANPQDIANCVSWLVDGGDYVTGQVIEVDGGLSLCSNVQDFVH